MTMQGHLAKFWFEIEGNIFFSFPAAATAAEISMATEAVATSSSLGMSNIKMETVPNGNGGNNASATKMLPSFSDILWCPDIDGDVMSNPVMGEETIVSLIKT